MKFFSLCSGIGGFEKGILDVYPDSICVGYSEINKFSDQVYQSHFKHKNYGDMTKIKGEELPDFDLLVGGIPCQSFSIAGKRGGFNDTRGTLFFDYARILKAKQPRWYIIENVKGLVNHDRGNTLGTIMNTLWELGYTADYKVLNSKDFGVPQNRERVFIIGTNKFEGLKEFWHFDYPKPPCTPVKLADILEKDVYEKYFLSEKIQKRLKIDFSKLKEESGIVGTTMPETRTIGERDLVYGKNGNMGCLTATSYKQPPQILALNQPKYREYRMSGYRKTLTSSGKSSRQKCIELTSDAPQGYRVYTPEGISTTLASQAGGVGAKTGLYMINDPSRKEGLVDKNISPTLRSEVHGNLPCIAIPVLTPDRIKKRQNGRRFKEDGDVSFTLTSQDKHGVMVGEATQKGYAIAEEGDSINLSVPNSATRRGRVGKGVAQTLDTGMQQFTLKNARIRRLTPTECMRLQGFPDDWCDGLSDSKKYFCAGNAVTVNVIKALISKIS